MTPPHDATTRVAAVGVAAAVELLICNNNNKNSNNNGHRRVIRVHHLRGSLRSYDRGRCPLIHFVFGALCCVNVRYCW
jgi:hypothetical protein